MRQVHRAELVAALGRPCAYCGEPMGAPTRDHIRLRSQGRTLEPANKVLVCDGCNQNKGSRPLASWLYRPQKTEDPRAALVVGMPS
ncbi:HNH endonuclease [Bradyrhizobium sp. SZCCHNR1098]|uniref:HNH endonuclease n=1 Tax=Bradyrhizobium sp. SZCCHNR1098 TaxID=3057370 RepID=UPI00396770C6